MYDYTECSIIKKHSGFSYAYLIDYITFAAPCQRSACLTNAFFHGIVHFA